MNNQNVITALIGAAGGMVVAWITGKFNGRTTSISNEGPYAQAADKLLAKTQELLEEVHARDEEILKRDQKLSELTITVQNQNKLIEKLTGNVSDLQKQVTDLQTELRKYDGGMT